MVVSNGRRVAGRVDFLLVSVLVNADRSSAIQVDQCAPSIFFRHILALAAGGVGHWLARLLMQIDLDLEQVCVWRGGGSPFILFLRINSTKRS